MRPQRLEIRNFRGWKSSGKPLDLDRPLVLIIAENRRGKSSMLNAIEWCLFGEEVEKGSCGIPERADWEAAHRASGDATIEVIFTLVDEHGTARIVRRRAPDVPAREGDALEVETPAKDRLDGERAKQWMRDNGLPDWETWRRAFCQHQESARGKLTNERDRSSILARMLGLEDYVWLNDTLKEQKQRDLIKKLDEEQAEIERHVRDRTQHPSEELIEIERRLAGHGVEGAPISPSLAVEYAERMLRRAKSLAKHLGLEVPLPPCASEVQLPAVGEWAGTWADTVRRQQGSAERARELGKRLGQLSSLILRVEPLEARWKEAREQLDALVREHGDKAAQDEQRVKVDSQLKDAEDRVLAANAELALLRQARELLRTQPDPERCPVCGKHDRELTAQLDDALSTRGNQQNSDLEHERDELKGRRETLIERQRELKDKLREEADARRALETARADLQALVPAGRLVQGGNPLATAREEERSMKEDLAKLQTAIAEQEKQLDSHRRDLEVLRDIDAWSRAKQRAKNLVHPDGARSWSILQVALDKAADLAVDLDALATLAREAQQERSLQRESEVNRSLGEFFAQITGDETGQSVRVRVKVTAKGVSYDLVDETGMRALSILNQASLNALSLSLLFAQAEERARAGLSAWLVLDDPGQNLDAQHQAGLARAIQRVTKSCPVILGTPPGTLADRLVESTRVDSRRIYRLAPWDSRTGARVQEEVQP